jgi:hypothetical protein
MSAPSTQARPAISREAVLEEVSPGRIIAVDTTNAGPTELRDTNGRLAMLILEHFLGARTRVVTRNAWESFPLTEDTIQAVALRLGHRIGTKKCRALRRQLVSAGVLRDAGSYRQAYSGGAVFSGYRVTLYAVTRARLKKALSTSRGSFKRPVGKRVAVKRSPRVQWWAHPLFGDPSGMPPPGIGRRRAKKMRSLDEYGTPS